MAYKSALLNFSKGAISEEMEARIDLSIYNAGLRRAENVRIRRTGGVEKRMGTRFVAECLSTTAALVIPFQFSDSQAAALEFGQAYMRPLANGGAFLEEDTAGDGGLAVIGITNAAQAAVNVAYHAYSVGDQVYFSGILGMTEINDRFLTVTEVVDADHFKVDFDSSAAGVFTGSGGGITRSGAPAPPPPAPPVPSPLPDPTPPATGSGGGGGYGAGGGWNNEEAIP